MRLCSVPRWKEIHLLVSLRLATGFLTVGFTISVETISTYDYYVALMPLGTLQGSGFVFYCRQ